MCPDSGEALLHEGYAQCRRDLMNRPQLLLLLHLLLLLKFAAPGGAAFDATFSFSKHGLQMAVSDDGPVVS